MGDRQRTVRDFSELDDSLAALAARDLYRHRRVVEGPTGREIVFAGRRLLNFCSNDYLGLAADPRVRQAMSAAVERWGVGAGASHLVTGHSAVHHELESALAELTGRPRALLFSSGYLANVGTIHALTGSGDHVFEDRLNHASLLDGGFISRAQFHWYAHGDVSDLERQLGAVDRAAGRALVVTDGVFSMDGDLCPLPELVRVAGRAGAWLMVDDAHGLGVCGRDGCGTVDPTVWSTGDVPVLVGTLGKAFGTFGAFVAGSESLIEFLIQRARTYIYTTALPPALAAATLVSVKTAREEGWRRERLQSLIARFRAGAEALGLELPASGTPIQPIIVGESRAALALSAALEARGILVSAIRPPTVPAGTARLRVTFSAAHTDADVDRLLAALVIARKEVT